MAVTSYNPYDATQQSFLSALALGEAGKYGYTGGVGNYDLTGATTDTYGFPQWSGFGSSHAAGEFQFEPSTWDTVASRLGISSFDPASQNEAAWNLAQTTYQQKTGGDLTSALQSGNFTSIQSALAGVWPSVTGNGATPGLAAALTGGTGATIASSANAVSADTSGGPTVASFLANPAGAIGSLLERWGVLIVGALILLIALWELLSHTGVVPSPSQTVKAASKAAAFA